MKNIAHFKIARRRDPVGKNKATRRHRPIRDREIELEPQKQVFVADQSVLHRWSFMIADKLVFALIISLVISLSDYYFQKKNIEHSSISTLRQADLGEIKKAFNEVWPKLYAYEAAVNELEGAARSLSMHKNVFPESLPAYQADFDKAKSEESKAFRLAYDALKGQQHVLGTEMTRRSDWYLRYTRLIALVYEKSQRDDMDGPLSEIDLNAAEASRAMRNRLKVSLTDLNGLY